MKSKILLILIAVLFSFSSCENEPISNENITNQSKDPEGCETAFAFFKKGCFIDDGLFKRWGWVIGPLQDSHNESYDIYAGAGKCDTSKGTLVGTLTVSYDNGTVVVDYQAHPDWGFFETHLYVGNEKYPLKPNGSITVAPGQYGNSNSFPDGTSFDSYTIDNLTGDIYIIAHSVVCPFKKK